jgi:hypothetical protein
MSFRIKESTVHIHIHDESDRPMQRHLRLHFHELFLRPNPNPHPRTLRGLTVNFTLEVDEIVSFSISATDEWGNPTTAGLGTAVLSGFDATLVAGVVNADGSITLTPTGKLGSTQVVVTVPVTPPPGAPTGTPTSIVGDINLTLIAGQAVDLIFTPTTTGANPVPAAGGGPANLKGGPAKPVQGTGGPKKV